MSTFNLDDLVTVMRACAGDAEPLELDGDILDVPFGDLGYDSLALLETLSRIEQQSGRRLDEGTVQCETPRLFLASVNEQLSVAV
jgi:act minimal PKS acyl carrier protein